jgi:hypothetical protein
VNANTPVTETTMRTASEDDMRRVYRRPRAEENAVSCSRWCANLTASRNFFATCSRGRSFVT